MFVNNVKIFGSSVGSYLLLFVGKNYQGCVKLTNSQK